MYNPHIAYCFTGTLIGKKIDTQTLSPRTLMTDIMFLDRTLFRDHTWVSIRRRLDPFIPLSSAKHKTTIAFTAKIEQYASSDGTTKYRLHELRHIRAVERSCVAIHRGVNAIQ